MDRPSFTRYSCRLCLTESEFNVSLFGNYAMKTHIVEKILASLKVVVEDTDTLTTICYKCAGNVERYYDFVTVIRKSQNRLNYNKHERQSLLNESFSRRRLTCMVEEFDAAGDCTFSFLELPEEKKEKANLLSSFLSPSSPKPSLKEEDDVWKIPREVGHKKIKPRDNPSEKFSNPFLPYKSQQKLPVTNVWKMPREVGKNEKIEREEKFNEKWQQKEMSKPLFMCIPSQKQCLKETDIVETPREVGQNKKMEYEENIGWKKNSSRDLFGTQSQEEQPNGSDSGSWKLTPEDNIIKRVRAKFGWN